MKKIVTYKYKDYIYYTIRFHLNDFLLVFIVGDNIVSHIVIIIMISKLINYYMVSTLLINK